MLDASRPESCFLTTSVPFLLAGLMATLLLVAPASAQDWLCWKGERVRSAAAPARLDVTDRFVAGHLALARPARLCRSVADGVVPSEAPVTAAAWTVHRGRRTADDATPVTVTNRFGETMLRVRGVASVLATEAGWLACHEVRAMRRTRRRATTVVIGDAGGLRTLLLGRPRRLCVPRADADGPELLCHAVEAAGAVDRGEPPRGPVDTVLGRVDGAVGSPSELCVESTRTVMPTPPGPEPGTPPPPPPPAVGGVLRVGRVTRTLIVGDKAILKAFIDRPNGTTSDWSNRVQYHSGDERVAVVHGNVLEAVRPGTVEISATDPSSGLASTGAGNAPVTVAWPLERIEIHPRWLAMQVGEAGAVDVWGIFENGQWRNLTAQVALTSSVPGVAVLSDEPGIVHAVGRGTSHLVATDQISGLTSTDFDQDADVYVTGGLRRIEIRGDGVSHYYPPARAVGETYRFTAVGVMTDGSEQNFTQRCLWQSSDPAIAVAANPGGDRSRIDPLAPGTVRISCRDQVTQLPSNERDFDVVGALARIDLDVDAIRNPVRRGKPRWGTAIGVYHPFANDSRHGRRNLTQAVTWTSRDPGIVAMPNEEGVRSRIDFVASGQTEVFATDPVTGVVSNDGTVRAIGDPEGLSFIRKVPLRAQVGGIAYYRVRGDYGGVGINLTRIAPEEYVLEADDPAIAGQTMYAGVPAIVGLQAGVTNIRARHLATGVVSEPSPLTVLGDLVRVVLSPTSILLGVGETDAVTGFGEYAPGVRFLMTQELVYTSSNPAVVVATNDPDSRSRVRAIAPGSAVISATDPVTGISSTASGDDVTVEVIAGPPLRISITPSEIVLVPNLSTQLTARAHWPDGRATNVTQQVVWSSLAPQVAAAPNDTSDRSRVYAQAPGTATIVATHPSGVSSAPTGDNAVVRVRAIEGRTLAPAVVYARVGETVRFTFTATLSDGSSLNLTQRASYDAPEWTIAQFDNAVGDRSAAVCLAPGTAQVEARSDDVPSIIGLFFPSRATLVCLP